jgi:uncharacterized protein (TIGR04255 family)
MAILMDIDVSQSTSVPQNDEDIFALLNEMRVKKNNVFEACVTDQSRELFR